MKKVLVVAALAMLLVVATACSGGAPSGNSGSSSGGSSNTATESQGGSGSSDSQAADKPADNGAAATDQSKDNAAGTDLTTLASKFTEAYMGATEKGETMYYAGNADGSLAVLVFYDVASNKNVSFVGPATSEGTAITIKDASNGLSFTFNIEAAADGGIVIDTGDSGKAVLAKCDVMEVLKAMQAINDYSTAIA